MTIWGGLGEGIDMGVGGNGTIGQTLDIVSGGAPKTVLDMSLFSYGVYNSNIGQKFMFGPRHSKINIKNLTMPADKIRIAKPNIHISQ